MKAFAEMVIGGLKIKRLKNSRILRTIPILILICLFSFPAQAKYSGGTGEPNDPYLIYTAEQMNAIGVEPNDWDKHFKLMAEIDLSCLVGSQFNTVEKFYGVFDGNGKRISNYECGGKEGNFFGRVYGEVKNLTIVDCNMIKSDWGSSGGMLVGTLRGGGTIRRCYVQGGHLFAPGHTGGGLVGENRDGLIIQCGSSASVVAEKHGHGGIGGLVGENRGGISQCYFTGEVSGDNPHLAGLVAVNEGVVSDCFSAGIVRPDEDQIGGAGLVGENSGVISQCYSVSTTLRGLVAWNSGTVTASFWDIEASGCIESAGGTGLTTAEMQTASTFLDAGWDFINIWGIGENQTYPYLQRYSVADINQDETVNFPDLAILADNWLAGIAP